MDEKSKRFGEIVFNGEKVQVGNSILFSDVYKNNEKFKIQISRINITDEGEVFVKVGRLTSKEAGVVIEALTASREYIKKKKTETEKEKTSGKIGAKKTPTKVARKVTDEDAE